MSEPVPVTRWEGEPVDHWRMCWGLPALHVFSSVPSTNDVLRAAGAAGSPAGTCAIAEHQSQGRGRLGRRWEAPEGTALLLSVLLRPGPGGSPAAAAVLPLRIGLAIAEAIASLAPVTPGLKWPNDVLLDGRKTAGILCEAAADFVVAGIGVNVGQGVEDFPPELRDQATSLRLAAGAAPSRAALAGAILRRLAPLFTAPHQPLSLVEIERFTALDVLAGRPIRVDDAPSGIAIGVTPLGSLLADVNGERTLIHAGTVRSMP